MKTIKNLLLTILILPVFTANAATDSLAFSFAHGQINAMLDGKHPLSYEEAIYQVENAWWGGSLDYVSYQAVLGYHTDNIKLLMEEIRSGNKAPVFAPDIAIASGQQQARYDKLLANYAIYTYLTQPSLWLHEKKLYYNPACSYATADPMGTTDWTNTHVTRLLNEGTGNCFALASLYKILADRLGADAELCTAPGHIYIRHADEQGSLHNVELGGRNFPGTGSIEAVTYTTSVAVKNGIALRPLNKEQQVALALVYLAKGREYRLGANPGFALACAETALQHDALNLNALLLKAEAMEAALLAKGESIEQLKSTPQLQEYEQWLGYIYSLGYREMPLQMKNTLIKGWTRDTITTLAETTYTQAEQALEKKGGDTRYASTSWGLFNEDVRTVTVERLGRTLYNVETGRIEAFASQEQLYNHYNFDPVVFAWNMDPKTEPGINPYTVFRYNPIMYIDPAGDYVEAANGDPKERVSYEILSNGKIIWSSNASYETRLLGTAMLRTEKGREVFEQMQQTPYPIRMLLNNANDPAFGRTKVIGEWDDKRENFVPKRIELYVNTKKIDEWKKAWDESGETPLDKQAKLYFEVMKYDVKEGYGATSTHEGIHATDQENINDRARNDEEYNKTGKRSLDEESKPEEVETIDLNERVERIKKDEK